MLLTSAVSHRAPIARSRTIARAWYPATTLVDLMDAQYRRVVVPIDGVGKILVQELDGEVYALSNKCTHLGLPLQGKIVGKELADGCVVCPFHDNKFDVKTGELSSEWAPGFPSLPFVGKVSNDEVGLKTYPVRVEDGRVEVEA